MAAPPCDAYCVEVGKGFSVNAAATHESGTQLAEQEVEVNAMSLALYRLRLYWDGRHGAVRNGKDTRILVERPLLRGAANAEQLEEIDYAPEVNVMQVRERTGDWRQMTSDEIAACDALLAELHEHDAWANAKAA